MIIITYVRLANVVNGLAWSLVEQPGGPGSSNPPAVVTYVGPNDDRYSAMAFAAAKVSYVVSLLFPGLETSVTNDRINISYLQHHLETVPLRIIPCLITSNAQQSLHRTQFHQQRLAFSKP